MIRRAAAFLYSRKEKVLRKKGRFSSESSTGGTPRDRLEHLSGVGCLELCPRPMALRAAHRMIPGLPCQVLKPTRLGRPSPPQSPFSGRRSLSCWEVAALLAIQRISVFNPH